ncbi:MAG: hypothetical protein AAB217_27130 [Chloroflexota bacterium]
MGKAGQGDGVGYRDWARCAAVYLNGTPVAYFEDADFDTSGNTMLGCQSLGQAVCEFDNVKFWNLANVPGLP